MKSIEPFLHQALEKVEQLKAAEALRCKSLEAVIGDFKQQQAKQRQAADAVEAAHRGEGSIRQGEPVQFSSAWPAPVHGQGCRRALQPLFAPDDGQG